MSTVWQNMPILAMALVALGHVVLCEPDSDHQADDRYGDHHATDHRFGD